MISNCLPAPAKIRCMTRACAAAAIACGLSLWARAQIGTGWTPATENYQIQTSAGCTAAPLPSGVGGIFNIPSSSTDFRAEFRFEYDLNTSNGDGGFISGTEQFQGDVTVNSLGGNRVTVKQTFGPAHSTSWSLIAIDKTKVFGNNPPGAFYDVGVSGQPAIAAFTLGQTYRINTILTFSSGGAPTVIVYINGQFAETLTKSTTGFYYDKVGAYKSSSGSGPCTSTWQNVLFWTGGSGNGNTPVAVDTPSFSPPAGTYTSAQSVTLSTTTAGAVIRYTTDGSLPSETSGTIYSGPVTVGAPDATTINAIAYESGQIDGPVSAAVYTLDLPPPIPTALRIQGSSGRR
jgi:hypothetical protein